MSSISPPTGQKIPLIEKVVEMSLSYQLLNGVNRLSIASLGTEVKNWTFLCQLVNGVSRQLTAGLRMGTVELTLARKHTKGYVLWCRLFTSSPCVTATSHQTYSCHTSLISWTLASMQLFWILGYEPFNLRQQICAHGLAANQATTCVSIPFYIYRHAGVLLELMQSSHTSRKRCVLAWQICLLLRSCSLNVQLVQNAKASTWRRWRSLYW